MYCGQCGNPLNQSDRFCGVCGASTFYEAQDDAPTQEIPVQSQAAQGSFSRSRNRTLMWSGIAAAVVVLIAAGAVGALAFRDGLGLLGGSDSQQVNSGNNSPGQGSPGVETTTSPSSTSVPTTSEPTTNPSSTEQQPEEVLARQYEYVNDEDYRAAYELFADQSQEEVSFQQYRSFFEDIGFYRTEDYSFPSTQVDEDEATVDVEFTSVTPDSEGQLQVTQQMVLEDGSWRIIMRDDQIDAFTGDGGGDATDEEAVEEAIRSHYEAIGRGDFEEAYSYFGPTFRDENTKESWISEEQSQGIQDSTINSIEVTEVSGDTATAEVDVEFEDNRGNPRFNLTWSLVKENGEWKLDDLVSGEEVS